MFRNTELLMEITGELAIGLIIRTMVMLRMTNRGIRLVVVSICCFFSLSFLCSSLSFSLGLQILYCFLL